MSFTKVKNQNEIDKLVQEYVQNRRELRQQSIQEKVGVIEQEKAIEQFQKPVTSLLSTTVKEDGTTRTYSITDLINAVGNELVKQGVEQENQSQILYDLSQDTLNSTQALANIGLSLYENGATQDEILQFVYNIATTIGDPKLLKDTVIFSGEVEKGIKEQINDLQTAIIQQEKFIDEEADNMTDQDFEIITQALNDNRRKLDELVDTEDKMLNVFDELIGTVRNVKELDGDNEIENVILQTTSGTASATRTKQKTTTPIGPPPPRFSPESQTEQKLGEFDISEFDIQEINFPDKSVYMDFTLVDEDKQIFSIFDNTKLVQIIDNKLYDINKRTDPQTGKEITQRIGQPIQLTDNVFEILINGSRRKVGGKDITFASVKKQLSDEEKNIIKRIYELVDLPQAVLNINSQRKSIKNGTKYKWLRDVLDVGGIGTAHKSNPSFGYGMNVSLKIGNGQSTRNPYKINSNGMFGQLKIDVPQLVNYLRLRVFKDDKLMADQTVDKDTFDLLTKRFNPKRKYSDNAISIFRDLVEMSKLPLTPTSNKFNLLTESQRRGMNGNGYKKKKQTGGEIKIIDDPELLVDRLGLLAGSVEAGNNSYKIKNEIGQIADLLLKRKYINEEKHKNIYENYILHY